MSRVLTAPGTHGPIAFHERISLPSPMDAATHLHQQHLQYHQLHPQHHVIPVRHNSRRSTQTLAQKEMLALQSTTSHTSKRSKGRHSKHKDMERHSTSSDDFYRHSTSSDKIHRHQRMEMENNQEQEQTHTSKKERNISSRHIIASAFSNSRRQSRKPEKESIKESLESNSLLNIKNRASWSHPQSQPNELNARDAEWRVAIDPKSKRPYYYHPITRETTWKKPKEMIAKERAALAKEKQDKKQFFSAMEQNIRSKLRTGNWFRHPTGSNNERNSMEEPEDQDFSSSASTRTSTSTDVNNVSHPTSPTAEDDAQKVPMFRTLSSYETPVLNTSNKKGTNDNISSTSLHLPSPVHEASRRSDLEWYTRSGSTKDKEDEEIEEELLVEEKHMEQVQRSESFTPASAKYTGTRRRSNSTSTIYVRMGTMHAPDQECTIHCVATVLRGHMLKAQEAPIRIAPEYKVFIDPDLQLPSQINVHTLDIPSLDIISSFISHVYNRAQMESECIIMSLIYVERLLKARSQYLQLLATNWRSILFCSMVMASKVWDDLSMCNADFSKIWPRLSLKEINELEMVYLSAVEYNVRVSAASYAKYYFHLRSLCSSMDMLASFDEGAPLNIEGARKMQVLSEEYQKRSKLTPEPRRRSITITTTNGHGDLRTPRSSKAGGDASLEQLVRMEVRGAGGGTLASLHRWATGKLP